MKYLYSLFLVFLCIIYIFSTNVYAYTDEEINMITNVVNGEVGGICGNIVVTYSDGSIEIGDAMLIRKYHSRVVANQQRSDMFPDTIESCIYNYWSPRYAESSYGTSEQWINCREVAETAQYHDSRVPINLYAATCDPYFDTRFPPYKLWARVDWDTGWVSGTFYYYSYGDPIYIPAAYFYGPPSSIKYSLVEREF